MVLYKTVISMPQAVCVAADF